VVDGVDGAVDEEVVAFSFFGYCLVQAWVGCLEG
jgi:hypothetical protein